MFKIKTKLKDIIVLLRPYQWIKNLFIFAPFFFAFDYSLEKFLRVLLGFILFSFVASAVYVLNDLKDIEEDKLHPVKKNRPLASGKISYKTAYILIGILLLPSFSIAYFISLIFFIVVATYFILNYFIVLNSRMFL